MSRMTTKTKNKTAPQVVAAPIVERRHGAGARQSKACKPSSTPVIVGPVSSRLILDSYLPYQFALLSAYLSEKLSAQHHGFSGLTVSEWRVMAIIGASAALSAAEIASSSGLDEVAVHRAVKGLLQKDYVVRRTAGSDKRRKPLGLTRRGKTIYARITPLARELERELLAFLTPPQERLLRNALSRICAGFGLLPVAVAQPTPGRQTGMPAGHRR